MGSILLRNRHLVIDANTAASFFEGGSHVNMVYYAATKTLMLAPVTDELFKSLHKAAAVLLKDKNLKGDKSVSLEEMLIDHDLDPQDRDLQYKADAVMRIVSIYFE